MLLLRIKEQSGPDPFRASDAKPAILWQPHLMGFEEAESGKTVAAALDPDLRATGLGRAHFTYPLDQFLFDKIIIVYELAQPTLYSTWEEFKK